MYNATRPIVTLPPEMNTTMNDTMNGLASALPHIYLTHCPEKLFLDMYITPFIYAIGFPGNVLAFFIWINRRMRNSSGYYLAALAVSDFIFLCLHLMYELHRLWGIHVLNFSVVCEMFTIFFLAVQYMSPLLVLGFTVERYISICHPFKREHYCTTKRAKVVIACLALLSLLLCAIQGYFYTFKDGDCGIRDEVMKGGTNSIWSVWSWVTEMLIFLVVPVLVLMFNILVIKEARRLSDFGKKELGGPTNKTSATTIMLLAVSFYLIFTTLPATVVYLLSNSFPVGKWPMSDAEIREDSTWQNFLSFELAKTIIFEMGITHYAFNFYIYLITGKQFRTEFKKLLYRLMCREYIDPLRTEYSSLRTASLRDSCKIPFTRETTNGHAALNSEENTSNL